MPWARLRRWWRDTVIRDFKRELPVLVRSQRQAPFIRDASGIPVGVMPAWAVLPSVTCPDCGMTSYNPEDIRQGYCGNCRNWTSRPAQRP